MELKDLVNILTKWNVKHLDLNSDCKLDGLTLCDKKEIYLIDKQTTSNMRQTVIHECLHAHYDTLNQRRTERQIINETNKLYRYLFK